MENENWEYKITGQKGSLPRIIFIGIIAVFMAVLAIDQFKPAENKSLPLAFYFYIYGNSTPVFTCLYC